MGLSWDNHKSAQSRYRRRKPEKTGLYRLIYHYHEQLEWVWDEQFRKEHGVMRDEAREASQAEQHSFCKK